MNPVESEAGGRCDVAFQGVAAAFAEEAALALVGATARTLPCRRLEDVFAAVEANAATFAAIPIENSLAGSVVASHDLLGARALHIVGELVLRVSHALIAPPGVVLADVRRVFSHPVALAQCEEFFRKYPTITPITAYNTAGAVRDVIASAEKDTAAIASRRAAELYGGVVLLDGVEDDAKNFTRFLLLARPGTAPPLGSWGGERKTSILFRLAHRPGTLAAALAVFASRSIDLIRIESRPIRGKPFEYAFFIDLVGDAADPVLSSALIALSTWVEAVKVLGSYAQIEVARSLG